MVIVKLLIVIKPAALAPEKLITPSVPAFKFKLKAASPSVTVAVNPIACPARFPSCVVSTEISPVSVVAELKLTTAAVVVISPAVLMPVPPPVKLTAPSEVMSPNAPIVNPAPPLSVTVPPLLKVGGMVVTVLFSAIVPDVTTFKPASTEYVCAPLNVVAPVPAICRKLAALIEAAVTLNAELIVIVPTAAPGASPTGPVKVTLPVPAVRVKLLGLRSSVLRKLMSPAPTPVSTAIDPSIVVAELKFTTSPVVVMLPAVLMPAALVKLTAPSEVMSPNAPIVNPAAPLSVTVPLFVPASVSIVFVTLIELVVVAEKF